jgi:Protein of unknown function (DUF2721)
VALDLVGWIVALIDQFGDLLKLVATAVTPVVMVSATAILISGVNARYISISDRVRTLAREYRDTATSELRRVNIRRQTRIFHRRLHLVSWAARVLYTGAGSFAIVALLIGLSVSGKILPQAILVLFLIGLALIVVAIVLQLLELQQSNRTIDLESSEILSEKGAV